MRKSTRYIHASLTLGLSAALLPATSQAKNKSTAAHAQHIESVLDRLEKRLIDKESSPLTLEEQEASSQKISNEPKQKQQYVPKAPAKITGRTPNGRNLQEIQKKINEYDNRIEILESDLRKLQSTTNESAATDNTVALEIKTPESAKISIRTLSAKLDGNILYSQVDPAGVWMPTKSIPIFYGPLQPGSHTIEIDGYIAAAGDTASNSDSWRQKSFKQSLSFTVPEGKVRKVIAIEIGESKTNGSGPTAKLIESEQK